MSAHRTRLIVALDTKLRTQATQWARETEPYVDAFKVGMEFIYAQGMLALPDVARSRPLFLDLKLHDIPNTVASAIEGFERAGVTPLMTTIHACGGPAMIAAAKQAICDTYPDGARPLLLAVTVLTSMDEAEYQAVGGQGSTQQQVVRLGRMACSAGADGLVCSPHEISLLREALGDGPVLVVPGIRPEGTAGADDQKRVMTPAAAHAAGADWIVVGRPITRAEEPARIAQEIAAQLRD